MVRQSRSALAERVQVGHRESLFDADARTQANAISGSEWQCSRLLSMLLFFCQAEPVFLKQQWKEKRVEVDRKISVFCKMKYLYVYILECSDGNYYTGVTNNPERRLSEHNSDNFPESYTHQRRPLTLKFCEYFTDPQFKQSPGKKR